MNKTSLLGSLLLAFLIWRVITLLIFSSAGLYSPVHPEHLRFSYARALPVLAKVFSTGDASWYLDIAANGYKQEQFSNKDQSNWAFFPVLPILIHGASYLTADNYILAGAIIANIALLAALILLFKFILP